MSQSRNLKRIGMLTPSSNTVLEPMVADILRDKPDVTAHFSRLPVTEISLADAALGQFELDNYLAAARLLADARVDVIGWNGTSASWRGFEADHQLCAEIEQRFGVKATTAVLAMNELLEAQSVRRIALVTPYISTVQDQIIEVYSAAGYECVAERHFGEQVNYAFAEIGDAAISEAIADVASAKPDAVLIVCTNLRAAHLADRLEKELDVTVIDSITAFVWKAVQLCGGDRADFKGWGRAFEAR